MGVGLNVRVVFLATVLVLLYGASVSAVSSSSIVSSRTQVVSSSSVYSSSAASPPAVSQVSSTPSYTANADNVSSSSLTSSTSSSKAKQESSLSPGNIRTESSAVHSFESNKSYSSHVSQNGVQSNESFSSFEISSSSLFILPEVVLGDISVPRALEPDPEVMSNDASRFIFGLIAWGCIILCVLIVVIVLFGGKKDNPSFIGRKKYRSRSKKNRRLLPDKYYRNLKRRK